MKKKIIFVSKALWIGGIETALVNLLNHMDYDKYDVTCLVLKAELDMAERIHPKCRLLVIDREKTVSFSESYQYNRLFGLAQVCEHPSKLHQLFMWTVPMIRWIENELFIAYIRKLMKDEVFDTAIIYSDVVVESTIRGIKALKYLMYYHHGAMRRVYHDEIGYKRCDKVIAVSENQARELRDFVPKYADKVTVIHNLVNIEEICNKANEPIEDVFDKNKINIVSCGRVSHEKGMDIAVRVCAELVSQGMDNIKWWIVGGGPAEQEVRDTIEECHMEDYIIMTGMKNNPYPYIKNADLYVQPSRYEGYPMTILEAIVLGKVVVSTDNNGAKEILKNNGAGVLCSVDISDISKKIGLLLNDKSYFLNVINVIKEVNFNIENKKIINDFLSLL